jgi:hypothetical protein
VSWWRRDLDSATLDMRSGRRWFGSPGTSGGRGGDLRGVVTGELKLGRGGASEDVWEVDWSMVSSNACSRAVFIGQRGGHRG